MLRLARVLPACSPLAAPTPAAPLYLSPPPRTQVRVLFPDSMEKPTEIMLLRRALRYCVVLHYIVLL